MYYCPLQTLKLKEYICKEYVYQSCLLACLLDVAKSFGFLCFVKEKLYILTLILSVHVCVDPKKHYQLLLESLYICKEYVYQSCLLACFFDVAKLFGLLYFVKEKLNILTLILSVHVCVDPKKLYQLLRRSLLEPWNEQFIASTGVGDSPLCHVRK